MIEQFIDKWSPVILVHGEGERRKEFKDDLLKLLVSLQMDSNIKQELIELITTEDNDA